MQRDIIAAMVAMGANPPASSFIGNLPRTGDIVDAIGRNRDKAGFASVSRALARLRREGLVNAYVAEVATRGHGYRWSLNINDKEAA